MEVYKMSVRNTLLGGSDYGAEGLDNSDLNDTNNALISLRINSTSEDTTEYSATHNETDWVDVGYSKTFTCPLGVYNVVQALKIVADTKRVTSGDGFFRVKMVNNTNSAITYFYVDHDKDTSSHKWLNYLLTSSSSYVTRTAYASAMNMTSVATGGDEYGEMSITDIQALFGGATYTFTIQTRAEAGDAGTGYITNITLTLFWMPSSVEQVSGFA